MLGHFVHAVGISINLARGAQALVVWRLPKIGVLLKKYAEDEGHWCF